MLFNTMIEFKNSIYTNKVINFYSNRISVTILRQKFTISTRISFDIFIIYKLSDLLNNDLYNL